jgi:type I restriction enzyme M protein
LLGSGKDMQDRLSNLVAEFETFDFKSNTAGGDDLLGDAYEYLMRKFATASGKSKGQFYTPSEVSWILAKVVGINEETTQKMTVYDPTCGSGSLLLKAAEEAPKGITVYGQENDQSTYALCRMNMIIHKFPTAEIKPGNTLSSPQFIGEDGNLKRFDFAVANPPFSYKSWTNGIDVDNDIFKRFECGSPPPKNGDYAFLLHILKSLKSRGKAAVILPHGVLFRGNKEAVIRKYLVDQGYIRAIISLPPNLFYGTGISACIIILDKENADQRETLYILNASKGFVKDGNKNRLREQDIKKIVDYYSREINEHRYSRTVPLSEISSKDNEYHLHIPRYIEIFEKEDPQDLGGHMLGGIPKSEVEKLNPYWDVFAGLKDILFFELREGYLSFRSPKRKLKSIIESIAGVKDFKTTIKSEYSKWMNAHLQTLYSVDEENNPKKLIDILSDDMFNRFAKIPLLGKYEVYQCIMEYWKIQMQDDVHLIINEGWDICKEYRIVEKGEMAEFTLKKKKKNIKYVGQTIPISVIKEYFYPTELAQLSIAEMKLEKAETELLDFEEEHTVEAGHLDKLEGKNGKITKGNVQERCLALKKSIMDRFHSTSREYKQAKSITKKKFGVNPWTTGIIDENGDFEELDTLHQWICLNDDASNAKNSFDELDRKLTEMASEKYSLLNESECKKLVVEEKWFKELEQSLEQRLDQVLEELISRLSVLFDRYKSTLSELEEELQRCSGKVEAHYEKLGMEF